MGAKREAIVPSYRSCRGRNKAFLGLMEYYRAANEGGGIHPKSQEFPLERNYKERTGRVR